MDMLKPTLLSYDTIARTALPQVFLFQPPLSFRIAGRFNFLAGHLPEANLKNNYVMRPTSKLDSDAVLRLLICSLFEQVFD